MRSNLGLGVSNEWSGPPLYLITFTASLDILITLISNFFQKSVPKLMIAFNHDLICDLDSPNMRSNLSLGVSNERFGCPLSLKIFTDSLNLLLLVLFSKKCSKIDDRL